MALVIEDGSGVAGANSYATVAEARAYASARGLTLPATDGPVEILLVQAADFLDSLEDRYKGERVAGSQALAWPREEVVLPGDLEALPSNQLPSALKKAQCQLAVDGNIVVLQPTGTGREVIKTKVDVIETEYAKRGSGTVAPELNKAMAILEPLFQGGGLFLHTLRV